MKHTRKNLESAFAGESSAHAKYLYFAKLSDEQGYPEIAQHFRDTAKQELLHAWSHLELLISKPSVKECLELAIAGETYEYTEMYPHFAAIAKAEGDTQAQQEALEQASESKAHAEQFKSMLTLAEKRFNALKRVEKHHADKYAEKLRSLV